MISVTFALIVLGRKLIALTSAESFRVVSATLEAIEFHTADA
jgi:hypothetical protein